MYQVEDEPVETIHLYVVRETPARPRLTPIILSLLTLSLLIVLGVTTPYTQPVTRTAIRVPAVPTFIRSYSALVAIIPTGVKTYPATVAHGILTITNGSIIGQSIPAGFIVQGVATDTAIYVPGGDANGYGSATVPAHALISGKGGNFATLAIDQVIGSSLYIRNLSAFSGGRDSYSVKYVNEQDKHTAIMQARDQLSSMVIGLHYPCSENLFGADTKVVVAWHCQFVMYTVPSYMHVLRVRLSGKNLLIDVAFTPPPVRIWAK